VRKPAQSFEPGDATTDASLLGDATGVGAERVCPPHRWYSVPLAPPMAADALGRPPIAIADLVAELEWPADTAVGFVEGAGGLCSPIAHDGDTLSLVERLRPDLVVLVADPALGVVSQVRLTARALAGTPLLVVLNRYDPTNDVHRRSLAWLREVDALDVITDLDDVASSDQLLPHPARPAR
ncbi:MAG: dethiobiotin synthase, partial [Acidimicrobiales bacterium]